VVETRTLSNILAKYIDANTLTCGKLIPSPAGETKSLERSFVNSVNRDTHNRGVTTTNKDSHKKYCYRGLDPR